MIKVTGIYAQFYEQIDDKTWQLKGTKFRMQGGMLAFYASLNGPGFSALSILGKPRSHVITHPRSTKEKPILLKLFERGVLVYDPAHVLDNPTGCKECYIAKYDAAYLFDIADLLHAA